MRTSFRSNIRPRVIYRSLPFVPFGLFEFGVMRVVTPNSPSFGHSSMSPFHGRRFFDARQKSLDFGPSPPHVSESNIKVGITTHSFFRVRISLRAYFPSFKAYN